jgi:predicted Rossmann-fold nucleotide-binding protein
MKNVTISEEDLNLFAVIDTADEVINILEEVG